jgi:uncharacterized protein YbjT (DUF2867 family)
MAGTPILVLGATGGQGGAVARALLRHDIPVRALTRNPTGRAARGLSEQGVEVVAGSMEDTDALVAAMHGMSAVFALTTFFEEGVDAELVQGRAVIDAATRTRVPHLVFSSVACADQDTGVPHFESKARVEAALADSDVPYTVLGPAYFYDNALGGADRLADGFLDLPLPVDRPLQQLDRRDLGAFAVKVLLDPAPFTGRRIDLVSDAPTPARMAAELTDALGTDVRHEQVPLEAVADPDMQAMWRFLNDPGFRIDVPALHAAHPDIPWITFGDWARHTFRGEMVTG